MEFQFCMLIDLKFKENNEAALTYDINMYDTRANATWRLLSLNRRLLFFDGNLWLCSPVKLAIAHKNYDTILIYLHWQFSP